MSRESVTSAKVSALVSAGIALYTVLRTLSPFSPAGCVRTSCAPGTHEAEDPPRAAGKLRSEHTAWKTQSSPQSNPSKNLRPPPPRPRQMDPPMATAAAGPSRRSAARRHQRYRHVSTTRSPSSTKKSPKSSSRSPKDSEKYFSLLRVEAVNGIDPEQAKRRPVFENLVPVFPDEMFNLEVPGANLTQRLLNLVNPLGKGQRALIVSPPKAGKTTVLKDIANGILGNHPDTHVMVVLVGERPEEVTDFRLSV